MRDEGARYDAAAARIVYGMAFELFKRNLGEGNVLAAAKADTNVSH
jgi:hypothetical protein